MVWSVFVSESMLSTVQEYDRLLFKLRAKQTMRESKESKKKYELSEEKTMSSHV